MLINSAGQSRAERRLVDVGVKMWLSQPQSPVRRHVEAHAALRNNAFDFAENTSGCLEEFREQIDAIFGKSRVVITGIT